MRIDLYGVRLFDDDGNDARLIPGGPCICHPAR